MDRVLRSTSFSAQISTYDNTGALENPDAGAITADVVDSVGTAITGSPFAVSNPPVTAGILSFTVPAPGISVMDTYSVTWNLPGGEKRYSTFEVVGGFLFGLADFYAFDPVNLTAAKYPAALVAAVRSAVEDVFEDDRITGRAFRPKGRRFTHDGSGTADLLLPDTDVTRLVAASLDGTAFTSDDIADTVIYPRGKLTRKTRGTWGAGQGQWGAGIFGIGVGIWGTRLGATNIGNVTVLYEYGMAVTPLAVQRAAIKAARHELLSVAQKDARATSIATDTGTWRLSTAGRDGRFGLPDVDAVLDEYSRYTAQVGGIA